MRYGEWYFRGHENSKWTLRTGLDRDRIAWEKEFDKSYKQNTGSFVNNYNFKAHTNKKPFERKLEFDGISEFRSLTKGRFDASFTKLDFLGAMQHYGTHTRLLDFTCSPFVAVFFAFENESVFSERAVYAINSGRLQQSSGVMGAVEDFMRRDDGRELPSFAQERLVKCFETRHPNRREVYRAIAEMDLVQSEKDAIECDDIIPITLEGGNNRSIAQDGMFLFPLTFNYFDDVLAKMLDVTAKEIAKPALVSENDLTDLTRIINEVTMIKFIFDTHMNDSANGVLRQMNLSDRVIYPDLMGIARSINGMRYSAQIS